MELYDELAVTVLELLVEFGRPIVVHDYTGLTKDVATGTRAGTPVATPHNGVVVTYFGRLLSDYRIVGNASTMKDDVCVLMGGDTPPVTDGDFKLEFDGVKWSVFRVDDVAPGGTTVYKRVWVRR